MMAKSGQAQSPFKYVLFYKPYAVLTQFSDAQNRLTLKPFIPVPGIYAVGRLDRDSEGLLFLTNDGSLNARLIDPKFGHERTYWVQVEGVPTSQALDQLRQGVVIQHRQTRPAQVTSLSFEPELPPRNPPIRERRSIPTSWLELTLTEGRNRQVRRMTAAVGLPTLRLVRIQIGPLKLEGLSVGQWRELTPPEVQELQHYCWGQPETFQHSPLSVRMKSTKRYKT